jgi:hypothetical protein
MVAFVNDDCVALSRSTATAQLRLYGLNGSILVINDTPCGALL